jgi:tetratricopeptide (TPR) repeat protein
MVERPAPFDPKKTPTRQELDRLEALQQYARALQLELDNRLPEAVQTLEAAEKLDPRAAAIPRHLITLYLALDRQNDALAACRRATERAPGDFETWYQYAAILRSLEKSADAIEALTRAAGCADLKERADFLVQINYDLGVLLENAQQYERAEKAFRVVAATLDHPTAMIEHGPYTREELVQQAAEMHERLGRLALKLDQPERAVASFREAQRKDPSRAARLALNLAEVFAQQKRPAEALRAVEDYLATQPQGMEGYELKLRLLRDLGRGNQIVAALEEYSRRDAYNAALKLLLGRELRQAGERGRAEKLYLELIKDSPSAEAFHGLFAVYQDEGKRGLVKIVARFDDAVAAVSKKEEKARDISVEAAHARAMLAVLREDAKLVRAILPVAHERLIGSRFPVAPGEEAKLGLAHETRRLLAALAGRTRELDIAESLYRSCLDSNGKVTVPEGARNVEQEVYGGLLRVLWQGKKYREVVALCEQGLKQAEATNRVMFHLERARAEMALEKITESLTSIQSAVDEAAGDDRFVCRLEKTKLLAHAGKIKEAEAECRQLFGEYKSPGQIRDIRYQLSGVYSVAQEHAKSEEQLQRILEADPNDAPANNDLGYQWADQNKNLPEAEKMIRKALDLDRKQNTTGALGLDGDRDNAAYVDSLGWVLFRRGQIDEACREMERASSLPGGADDPVVWDHLGDVYFRLGKKAKAGEAWKKALELFDGGRRKHDQDRFRDIQNKLKLLQP